MSPTMATSGALHSDMLEITISTDAVSLVMALLAVKVTSYLPFLQTPQTIELMLCQINNNHFMC